MPLKQGLPGNITMVDTINLADDFDDVLLNEDPKDYLSKLPRVVSTITEYSDSSFSSRSSSNSTNSSAAEEEDDISQTKVDLSFAATKAAAKRTLRRQSVPSNRSSVVSQCSEDTSDLPSTTSTTPTDENEEFTLTANKLNGYAINTLKIKTSLFLLNPNQATAQTRHHIADEDPPLFSPTSEHPPLNPQITPIANDAATTAAAATAVAPSKTRNIRPGDVNRSNSASSLRTYRPPPKASNHLSPPSTVSTSLPNPANTSKPPSLLVQVSQASQGQRVKPFSKVSTAVRLRPVSGLEDKEEPDACPPLPNSFRSEIKPSLSASRLAPVDYHDSPRMFRGDRRGGIRRSSSTKSMSAITTMSNPTLPLLKNGLTPQQRLRLRRNNSLQLSVEQLELQCDSDEGEDDIPENVSVWNVPLSAALFSKAQQQQQQVQSKSRPKSAPAYIGRRPASFSDASSFYTAEGLSSIKEMEPTKYFTSVGLEHLSEDARNLTRAFQDLPGSKSTEQLPIESPSLKLPPKRRSSAFMDPVPISKEKDSVLSRTRPSWLPPKSPEEEKRHLYEYRQIMANAILAEKGREKTKRKHEAKRLKRRQQDELIWKKKVLPCFETAIQDPSTRELWWRGIPSKYRGLVWKARAGNTLGITQSTYDKALARGRERQAKLQLSPIKALTESDAKLKKMLNLMFIDAKSVVAEFGAYYAKGPFYEHLVDLLLAFAFYRPDIGYKSGMHYLGGIFLLSMSPVNSFIALAGTLNNSLCQAIYLRDESAVPAYYTSFLKVLRSKLPALYQHFNDIHLPPSAYLEPMLSSLFANHVSLEITNRLWDVMFFEGDSFLLRVALGVLMKIEHKLYGSAEDVLAVLGWGAPKLDLGDEDSLMMTVRGALKTN